MDQPEQPEILFVPPTYATYPPEQPEILFVPPAYLPELIGDPDPQTLEQDVISCLRTSGFAVILGFDVVVTENPKCVYPPVSIGRTFDELEKPTARPWYNQFRGSGFKKHRGRF